MGPFFTETHDIFFWGPPRKKTRPKCKTASSIKIGPPPLEVFGEVRQRLIEDKLQLRSTSAACPQRWAASVEKLGYQPRRLVRTHTPPQRNDNLLRTN